MPVLLHRATIENVMVVHLVRNDSGAVYFDQPIRPRERLDNETGRYWTVDSWKTYFEPPAELQGKIGSLALPDEVISAAQNYLGIKYCTEDPKEMKRVHDLLLAQKASVAAYSSDNIENRVGAGEVGGRFWWDGNSLRLRLNDKANVEYAMPKEGLVGWLDPMSSRRERPTSTMPKSSSTSCRRSTTRRPNITTMVIDACES